MSQDFSFLLKVCCFRQNHSTLSGLVLVIIAKQQTFRHKVKIFRKKKSSYIWLDKFPNEQFQQTFGTTSQNGLKVSLYRVLGKCPAKL
jgi:hypothetical protein